MIEPEVETLPMWWSAECDYHGCKARERLLLVDDINAITRDEDGEPRDLAAALAAQSRVLRAVAVGRGWTFGTHVGEPELCFCKEHRRG